MFFTNLIQDHNNGTFGIFQKLNNACTSELTSCVRLAWFSHVRTLKVLLQTEKKTGVI